MLIRKSFPRVFLIGILLAGQFGSARTMPALASPPAGVVQTIGDFLSLGANTVREVQEAIQVAGAETRATLEQLDNDISTIIQTLSQTYQDNLNVTIDSVDAVTRNKLLELQGLMEQVNQAIQEDITLASREAQEVIRTAGLEMRRATLELEQSLKNVIIVGGETAAFIIDRTVYNSILLISQVLLGLGLLIFIVLLFLRKVPSGWPGILAFGFIGIYLLLFGALVFIPSTRSYVMTFTGIGLEERLVKVANQPHILEIIPDSITLGQTREVEIWGSGLLPQGKSPSVKIANYNVPVIASSDQHIVVNVNNLSAVEGSANLVLTYSGTEGPREVVHIIRPTPTPAPPDLEITGFTVSPNPPTQGLIAQASITVRNTGGRAGGFDLQWKPAGDITVPVLHISGLNAGQEQTFVFEYKFPNAGHFNSAAIVDVLNSVAESNEGNNSRILGLDVKPRLPRKAKVTVSFTQITVIDDADGTLLGAGDIWFDFNINGMTARWPSNGTIDIDSGETVNLTRSYAFTLSEGEALTIYVKGTDDDDTSGDDSLGEVSKVYVSANEWGKGSHNELSSNSDGQFRIFYTITVEWIQ